jgi:transitional endoplasmic reticulum ATPase
MRRNSKSGIGEMVKIYKAEVKEAKKVMIAPAQKNIMVQAEPEGLRRGLLGRTVVKGDVVVLGGVQRRKDILSDEFPGEFGDMLGDMLGNLGGMGFTQLGGGFTQIKFLVINTSPNQPVVITENTEITLNPKAVEVTEESIPEINYEDIGGLTEEIRKIREMVEIPLKHPEIFERLGVEPPKGVLLHGPPGTGKTMLAKAVAGETEAHFILLNGPEIMSKFYGDSEKKIRDIFEEAEKNAPAIIFIDEIDSIAPKREDVQGEVERRVVSQLLTMMDGLNTRGKVVVIGATNRINSLDPALRRPGRFDREIEVGVPGKEGRLSILKIHSRGMPFTKDVKIDEIASITHGFVGADLESLCKEAAMSVLRKLLPKMKLEAEEQIPKEMLEKLIIRQEDFMDALKVVRPSAMREFFVEKPNITWKDVGGLEKTKESLREAIEWPIKRPELFTQIGIRPPRGILLYGSPGTGKTLLAKAVANESEINFISVKGPSLMSKWVNDSHAAIKKLFERARQVSPCIIFFDEFESIAGRRSFSDGGSQENLKVINQLLAEMDGLEDLKGVVVIGATNRPDMIDPAILRPGRFDRFILVDTPDEESRLKILEVHTKNTPLAEDISLASMAKLTEGFVGADIHALVTEAGMSALRRNFSFSKKTPQKNDEALVVTKQDFQEAFKRVKPSVSVEKAKEYKKIEEHYLQTVKTGGIDTKLSYTG